LNERFYGNWHAKNKDQVREKFGLALVDSIRRDYSARPPGGESLEDTTERVFEYFHETIEPELAAGKTLLLVAHGSPLRILANKLDGLPAEQSPAFEIANGDVLIYRCEDRENYRREDVSVG
jgi:2,3-bisphosphoglycerate-dependent phosphoglycerate mutase